ncbi:MAG: cobalamin biosynthesis protein CobD [Nitrospirae bacterium]|nr:cobalamin biosynthesis protein CobD [Nitrospirota bacterium]
MFLLTGIPLQLLSAFAVDVCVGDPIWIPHPVRYIGRLIASLESHLRKPARTPLYNLITGALAVVITVGATYMAALLFIKILPPRQYTLFNTISLYDLAIGIAGSLVLAHNGLISSVLHVRDKLEAADVEGARAAVSLIVGRDTGQLTQEGIARAAIETAAENASDAIIAPLFYFAIGGLPLALAYKAVNTLDSMIGYKNDKYLYFGRAAAIVDDIANYIPARLSGIAIVAAVFAINVVKLLRYAIRGKETMGKDSGKISKPCDYQGGHQADHFAGFVELTAFTDSLQTMVRDGRNHSSPNAGIPEAAMAGALGLRLGGPSYYGGALVEKPYIGRGGSHADASKITDAAVITAVASYIGLAAAFVLSYAVKYVLRNIV